MSEGKQIDEMPNDIAQMCPDLVNSGCGDLSCVACLSKGLEQMGYRKATDVAEEIFAEIEKKIADLEYQAKTPRKTVKVEELKAQMNWILHEVIPQIIAELKKKYTEDKK